MILICFLKPDFIEQPFQRLLFSMLTMAGSPKPKRKPKRQSAPIFSVLTQGISISNTFAGLSDLNDMDVGTGSSSQNVNTFHIKLADVVNVAFWPKKWMGINVLYSI